MSTHEVLQGLGPARRGKRSPGHAQDTQAEALSSSRSIVQGPDIATNFPSRAAATTIYQAPGNDARLRFFFSPCTREALGRAGPQSPGKEEEIAGGGGAESGDLVGKLLISASGTQRSQKWKSGGSSSSSGRHPPVAVPSQSHQHLKPCSWSVPEANQGVLLQKAEHARFCPSPALPQVGVLERS